MTHGARRTLSGGPGEHEDGFGLQPEDKTASAEAFATWVFRLLADPGQLWWILKADSVAGGIALRSDADPAVACHGHIGYGIRRSFRGRGLATWALGPALQAARAQGRDRMLIVCRRDNVASARVIEHLGGQLEEGRLTSNGVDRYRVNLSS